MDDVSALEIDDLDLDWRPGENVPCPGLVTHKRAASLELNAVHAKRPLPVFEERGAHTPSSSQHRESLHSRPRAYGPISVPASRSALVGTQVICGLTVATTTALGPAAVPPGGSAYVSPGSSRIEANVLDIIMPAEQEATDPGPQARRSIPGPAGALLRAQQRGLAVRQLADILPGQTSAAPAALRLVDADFRSQAWAAALRMLGCPGSDDLSTSGQHTIGAVNACETSSRIPQLCVVVASLRFAGHGDAFARLKDMTGTVGAGIHKDVLARNAVLSEGAVLILHDVPLLRLSMDARYLCINCDNIQQVVPKDATEAEALGAAELQAPGLGQPSETQQPQQLTSNEQRLRRPLEDLQELASAAVQSAPGDSGGACSGRPPLQSARISAGALLEHRATCSGEHASGAAAQPSSRAKQTAAQDRLAGMPQPKVAPLDAALGGACQQAVKKPQQPPTPLSAQDSIADLMDGMEMDELYQCGLLTPL